MKANLESSPNDEDIKVSGTVEYHSDVKMTDSESLARKLLFFEFIIDDISRTYKLPFKDILTGVYIAHEHKTGEEYDETET